MIVEAHKKEERVVVSWLKSHGYHHIVIEAKHSYIEADGSTRRMVVGVRTPETQYEDNDMVIDFAGEQNREPWIAVVEPDSDVIWYSIK
ncbi:hypothetical protein [Fluviicola sp.]|uniref:hypothetical protein n=1 Tax=Fluviicola sp. TaxID=1917219 RepID=UPI0031DA035B